MGIKFYCPNGHKLNVKSFLSGKKAICPQCGAKVTVPAQSQPAPGNAEADDQPTPENGTEVSPAAADQVHAAAAGLVAENFASRSPGVAAGPVKGAVESSQPAPIAGLPAGRPMAIANPAAFSQPAAPASPVFGGWANNSAPAAVGFGAREPIVTPQVPVAGPAAPAGFAVAGMRDAIDEAPAAVWYVRPASGGQFGPAPGETMRAWIDEGRVAATALVWRAGWPEWRSAAATFPKLAATVAAPWSPAPGFGAAPSAPVTAVQNNPWGGAAPAAAAPLGMAPVTAAGMVLAPVQAVGAVGPTGIPVGQVVGGLAVAAESYVGTDQAEDGSSRARKRRRQQTDMTMIVSIILVVLTVVLVIVLAVVLSRQQSEPEAAPAPTQRAPKVVETPKEKPAAKEKEPAKKSPPTKKAPAKKAKPAESMETDSFE